MSSTPSGRDRAQWFARRCAAGHSGFLRTGSVDVRRWHLPVIRMSPTQCPLPRSDQHRLSGRLGRKTEATGPEADCLLSTANEGKRTFPSTQASSRSDPIQTLSAADLTHAIWTYAVAVRQPHATGGLGESKASATVLKLIRIPVCLQSTQLADMPFTDFLTCRKGGSAALRNDLRPNIPPLTGKVTRHST